MIKRVRLKGSPCLTPFLMGKGSVRDLLICMVEKLLCCIWCK